MLTIAAFKHAGAFAVSGKCPTEIELKQLNAVRSVVPGTSELYLAGKKTLPASSKAVAAIYSLLIQTPPITS